MADSGISNNNGYLSEQGQYLANGGLLRILGQALGGSPATRAWLIERNDGTISHTFDEAIADIQNGCGGEIIPFMCLTNNERYIFIDKEPCVRTYIKTFGLNSDECEAVLTVYRTPTP